MNEELYHYGVKGMRWGVRRYQNPDGTLTAAGRKQYRSDKKTLREEKRHENKIAETNQQKASLYGRASEISNKRALKAQKKYEVKLTKDVNSEKNSTKKAKLKADIANKTAKELNREYAKLAKKAENHVEKLKEKYGEKNVKNIKYDSEGKITGNVTSASSRGAVFVYGRLMLGPGGGLGAAIASGRNVQGARLANTTRYEVKKTIKK